MLPVKQTKHFCTCLNGYVLPSGVLYGNVNHVLYYYNPENNALQVWNPDKKRWIPSSLDKFRNIKKFITAFMTSAEYQNIPVRYCSFEQNRRDKEFWRRKRQEREDHKVMRSLLPSERKANYHFMATREGTYSQRAIEGKMYQPSDYGENATVYDENGETAWTDTGYKVTKNGKVTKAENPFPVHGDENRPLLNADDPNRNFYDNGSKIVTITKRDGMTINQTKVRPEKVNDREFIVTVNGKNRCIIKETVKGGKSTVTVQ